MTIENELLEATKFQQRRAYADRQDYLAALARAVDHIEDDIYDALSNEASDWFNAAVRAMNNKKKIAEFADAPPPEPEPITEELEPLEEEALVEEEVEPEEKVTLVSAKIKPQDRKAVPPRKLKAPKMKAVKIEDENLTLNRYGVIDGSKNAAACELLERGCRMSDISETIGGTYYNLVRRLVKQGHRVEKSAHGLKLIHKDDIGKIAKGKGKA